MCVLAFAFNPGLQMGSDFHLRLISNRDEFFSRPTRAAHWWQTTEHPAWILGGRDLQAGGSWLAMSRSARLAVLTNFRSGAAESGLQRSRGDLVEQWVGHRNALTDASELVQAIASESASYAGFNLLLFDFSRSSQQGPQAWAVSNRSPQIVSQIMPGIHGLSNQLLNSPWPKSEALKNSLSQTVQMPLEAFEAHSLKALGHAEHFADEVLPSTGIGLERERYLSSVFIRPSEQDELGAYGTRCSSIIQISKDKVQFLERSWHPTLGTTRFVYPLT
jgi:uncharacterized protein with NRDE domain